MLYYFDSSVILAMLLDEKRRVEATKLWEEATVRVSSILLKLETITVLRRTYEHNKSKLDSSWLNKKTSELSEYFQEMNFRIIDEDIEKVFLLKKELAQCKTLDAVHIATAIELNKLVPKTKFYLYTFDGGMLKLAKLLKFKTNEMPEKDSI
jgi:predicted nucleic acid-binding protein